MIRTRVAVGAVAALTAAGLAVPAVADKPGDTDTTKTSNTTAERDCGDGDMVYLSGPDTLWPPNHKMVGQTAIITSSDDSEAVTLTFTPEITDTSGGDGGPQHEPDVSSDIAATGTGTAGVPFEVRAERSGKGLGRTYTFHWTAQYGMRKTCTSADEGQSPFTIFVPHDQGNGKATGRQ